jgi:hypothetical protein
MRLDDLIWAPCVSLAHRHDPCAWRFLDAQAVNLLDLLSSRGYGDNPG